MSAQPSLSAQTLPAVLGSIDPHLNACVVRATVFGPKGFTQTVVDDVEWVGTADEFDTLDQSHRARRHQPSSAASTSLVRTVTILCRRMSGNQWLSVHLDPTPSAS